VIRLRLTVKNDKYIYLHKKSQRIMLLFIDTETTGLPLVRGVSAVDKKGIWPDIVSVAWRITSETGEVCKKVYSLVRPDWKIPADSIKIHGITMEYALEHGRPLADVLAELRADLATVDTVVAHNMEFDKNVIFNAYKWRLGQEPAWLSGAGGAGGKEICTMAKSQTELKIPNPYPKYGPYKSPRLSELYKDTFGTEPAGQHNSQSDVEALCDIYWRRWGPYGIRP
jgi:DNA polymerase III epsilon subunit-like protein